MKAALTTLAAQSTAHKVAFLGDMLEMGLLRQVVTKKYSRMP